MTDETGKATEAERDQDQVIAEGVDEEPIESNRRLFSGRMLLLISAFATVYAAFHMAALNGLSTREWTGIDLPLLPQFPMETWNFRIVHIAGALALGFLLFSGRSFVAQGERHRPLLTYLAYALMVPALLSLGTALAFAVEIAGGVMWNGIDAGIRFNEVWFFGTPLLLATVGGILLSWFEARGRDAVSPPDILLAICGIAVAAYLIAVYGTAARNSIGTPFVPIGVAFAATAGAMMILELTRRVAGLALVIITGVFLAYTFTAHLLPGILAVQNAYS
ncbi:MAG: TRAP transporter permease, partial [Pseudomonadota bacterium]